MKVIVTGLVGQFCFGGVIWDYLQYVLGFQSLGHEVWYLEDSGHWAYDDEAQTYTADCSANVRALGSIMDQFGMTGRWIFRNGANGHFFGRSESEARAILSQADLIANVSGAALLVDYDLGNAHRMFLDGDPMFTQLAMLDTSRPVVDARIRAHDSHFSFGLNIGQPDCLVPTVGLTWKQTVQPVSLCHWPFAADPPRHGFTTVMNWASYEPKQWQGEWYGQKDLEFQRFIDLPRYCSRPFSLAMGQGPGSHRPTERLESLGWTILEPPTVVPDHDSYRRFLSESTAEWSIAKHGYVASRSGWFSCRTACYLAAGRPAVVQDTGWSRTLPSGEGLFAFSTIDECREHMNRIEADYGAHRRAARRLAEDFFAGDKVCARLIADAGLG